MSLRSGVMVLDGAVAAPLPEWFLASGPLEAAAALAGMRPDVIVVRGDIAWHRTFVRTLAATRRAAILSIGLPVGGWHADAYLPPDAGVDQISRMLSLLRTTTGQRRHVVPAANLGREGGWFSPGNEVSN